MKRTNYCVYRIYDLEEIIYVGRTSQPINQRMQQHMTAETPLDIPHIDPRIVKKIEYAICASEADMYLYEVYYINLYHPRMNCDTNASDEMSVSLPELHWHQFTPQNISLWRTQHDVQVLDRKEIEQRKSRIEEMAEEYKKKYLSGLISYEDYSDLTNQLWQQAALMK